MSDFDISTLTRFERDQLWYIAGRRSSAPYFGGKKTMPKLAAKGLVEPHPVYPRGWRVTDAGRDVYYKLTAATRP